jgi:hypothetical protein
MKGLINFVIVLPFFAITSCAQLNRFNYGDNKQAGHYAAVNGINLYYETY